MTVALAAWLLVHAVGPSLAPAPADVKVCPTCRVSTLREALATAPAGAVVRVGAGVYAEGALTVERSLTLAGEPGAVVDGRHEVEILRVTADGVTVRGLTFKNSGVSMVNDLAAVKFVGVKGCAFEDNTLIDNFFGVYLEKSSGCRIAGNRITGHAVSEAASGNAIHLFDTSDTTIAGNYTMGHRDGMYLEFSRGNVVAGNLSEKNLRYGLHFMYSHGSRYYDNVLRENGAGVAVMYSREVQMIGNRFEDNWGASAFGMLLKDINDSEIRENVFVHNTTGLYVEGGNRLNVTHNDFTGNGWALRVLANSMGILFADNNFVSNTFDVTTNGSRSYNSFLGNYWDHYRGYDLNRDAAGDIPYRPVTLFGMLLEDFPPLMLLLRSPVARLFDVAERLFPVVVPQSIADFRPKMERVAWSKSFN